MTKDLSPKVNALLQNIERRQQRSIFLTVLGIIGVVIIAAIIVFVSFRAVKNNLKELDEIKAQQQFWQNQVRDEKARATDALELKTKAEYETEQARQAANELRAHVNKLEKELEVMTERLRKATDFMQYAYNANFVLTLKSLFSNPKYHRQQEILNQIVSMQTRGIGWKLGGYSPEEGFDSPSFVTYILERNNLLGTSDGKAVRYRLQDTLPRISSADIGDVVFYAVGYALFFFRDETGTPFVYGMTPMGIHALRMDFAPNIGFGKVSY